MYMCYKLVQGFRVTCLFTGQYNTRGYDKITDVIWLLVGLKALFGDFLGLNFLSEFLKKKF